MARNILITRRDWMQDSEASFTSGVGHWTLPLSNLLDARPQVVAEAADVRDWQSTRFDVDLGYTRRVGLIGFVNLRATPMGTISVKAGTDSTFTTNNYSTLTTCWPPDGTAEFAQNAWGELKLTHTYPREEYEKLGMTRFLIPSAVINCRYVRVEIHDSTNGSSLQIGCFGVYEVWEPPINFELDWRVTPLDESDIQKVAFGSQTITARGRPRRLSLGLSQIVESEAWDRGFGVVLMKGKSNPLIAVPMPESTSYIERQGLYGLFSSDGQLSNPFLGVYALPLQIDQMV